MAVRQVLNSAPGGGQRPGFAGQVGGDHVLDFGGFVGQLKTQLGRQLVAQLQHGAGQKAQQLAVLAGCVQDQPARAGQGKGQQQHRQQGHHSGCKARGLSVGRAGQYRQLGAQPACAEKAEAHTQQAGQQPLPHDQQQRADHQPIAGNLGQALALDGGKCIHAA